MSTLSGISTSPEVDETPSNQTGQQPTNPTVGMATPGYTDSHKLRFGNSLFGAILPPALPKEGEEHLKAIQEHLRSMDTSIRTYPLPAPYVGTLFVFGDKGIITIYNDVLPAVRDPETTPTSCVIPQAMVHAATNYRDKVGISNTELYILQTVIVFKEDYMPNHRTPTKDRALASWIRSALIHNQDDNIAGFIATLDSLSPEKFRINYSRTECFQFADTYSPHGVHDRMDVIFGLDMLHEGTWKTIAVQGAYTEFRPAPTSNNYGGYGAHGSQIKFVPFIHLQNPITLFPNLSFLGIMLPLAMFEFGMRGLWQQPYRTFAQNQPNLGALFAIDPNTGQPPFIADATQMDLTIQENFHEPIYCIDILHGRANVPGLDLFAECTPSTNAGIGMTFAKFFNDGNLQGLEYVAKVYREITGAMTDNGVRKDTREIDLFYMVDKLPPAELDRFRMRGNNEFDRIKDIRDFFRNSNAEIESRYLNNIAFLNGQALSMLGSAVRNRISIETPERLHQAGISNAEFQHILSTYQGPMNANFNFTSPQSYNNYNNYNQYGPYFNSPYGYNR
jgi:hypothetical protein